jgi:cation transporter-like permease
MGKAFAGGGIGLLSVLGVVLVVLKLSHVITWSWWLVSVPMVVAGCDPDNYWLYRSYVTM